jgi:hypothetical protein
MDSGFNTEEQVILFDQEIHAMTLIYDGSSKSVNSPLYENSVTLGCDAASIGN